MGLDCSHGAFHGAYSAFNRFRQFICAVIGGSFPPHTQKQHGATFGRFDNKLFRVLEKGSLEYLDKLPKGVLDPDQWYWGKGYNRKNSPGLHIFFTHSDCGGNIVPEDCLIVVEDLEKVVEKLREEGRPKGFEEEFGHILSQGGFEKILRNFIRGLKRAAKTKKKGLVFC